MAALRYNFQAIPATDPWHPVLVRYLGQIPAKPDAPGLPGHVGLERPGELTSKVREVIFDCFGDFIGFVLESCCEHHRISSRASHF